MTQMKNFRKLRVPHVVVGSDPGSALGLLRALLAVAMLIALPPAFGQETLEKYYVHYCSPLLSPTEYSEANCILYRFTGAVPRTARPRVSARKDLPFGPVNPSYNDVQSQASFRQFTGPYPAIPIHYVGAELGQQCGAIRMPQPFVVGSMTTQTLSTFYGGGCYESNPTSSSGSGTFTDRITFGAPIRHKAYDGGIYEASPMVQTRDGNPWLTLYWGLNLGLVESQLDWDAAALSKLSAFRSWPGFLGKEYEFVLLSLPPPLLEGEITEYQNTMDFPRAPGGVYFYAASDADRSLLDSGAPGKWTRTGKKFNSGGYVSVCRFYGSVSPGPNSHFYTADDKECDLLKSLQTTPTPANLQQLNFEGKVFSASVPKAALGGGSPPICPVASIPLYRAYNAAYTAAGKKNYDSNHRFTTSRADIAEVVAKGWVEYGVVMCVPE